MKKHLQELVGTFLGGVTGYISSGIFDDWIRPLIIAGLCAFVGLLVTHFGKRLLKKLKL